MIKVGLGAWAAFLVLVSWGLVVLFVLGSSGWRVGLFGAWSVVLGSCPIWGIACVETSDSKEAPFFKLSECREAEEAHRALPNEALSMVSSGCWD